MVYVDTSVLVACYCPEPLSDKAAETVREASGPVISPLVEVEFCSAIATKLRRRELDEAPARRIVSLLHQHVVDDRYEMVPVGAREYDHARQWIGEFASPLRAPDALHLAAAFANDLTLLTADKDLAGAAEAFGVRCQLLS